MKTLFPLTVFFLVCLAGAAQADDTGLPLDKRISIEKLLLMEGYQMSLQTCYEQPRKAAKNSCIARKKDRLTKTIEDLENDPKAYFNAKERQHHDGKTVQEARKMVSSGKGI